MEWQPIETAPRDGTEIIAVFSSDYGGTQEKPTVYGPWTAAFRRNKWMASWDDASVVEREGYWGTDYMETPLDPTHWMPLPEPPRPHSKGE